MKSLHFSYDMGVQAAYIIRIKDHPVSEAKAQQCAQSCEKVNMPYLFWDAYDGTGDSIKVPSHLVDDPIMACIKLTNHYLVRPEVCCALSHISLWAHCVKTDRPLIILEHDAIMLQPYPVHMVYNSIGYLGCDEQANRGWAVGCTPPHGTDGPNYHFMLRAHAYAIDPAVAKNLLAYSIKYGIHSSLDVMLRADIFPIHQTGLYAYDLRDDHTTIEGRAANGRPTVRLETII